MRSRDEYVLVGGGWIFVGEQQIHNNKRLPASMDSELNILLFFYIHRYSRDFGITKASEEKKNFHWDFV